mmetsp:Transcript_50887/g.69870  ORF Transcript_50887/g.69870 Transcript_50887/m.69870 type:complete len:105 (-) Transcript_50887:148-462(-)
MDRPVKLAGCRRTLQPPSKPCSQSQAQPPAAVSQPRPVFWQHQAFLATDQPAFQLAKPALQSYGAEVATGTGKTGIGAATGTGTTGIGAAVVSQPPPVWQPLPV